MHGTPRTGTTTNMRDQTRGILKALVIDRDWRFRRQAVYRRAVRATGSRRAIRATGSSDIL